MGFVICTFWMIFEFLKFVEIKIYFPKLSDYVETV